MEHLQPTWAPASLPWLSFNLATTLMTIVTTIIVLLIAILSVRKLTAGVPKGMQNFLEWAVDFVRGIIGSTMDLKRGMDFLTLGMTIILFIFVGNLMGLPLNIVTIHDHVITLFGTPIFDPDMLAKSEIIHNGEKVVELAWWKSPTADANVTLAMSLSVIILTHIFSLKYTGVKNYFKGYTHPNPPFLPLNLIEEIAKILTLGFRLYGNIFAGEILIGVILMMPIWAGVIPLMIWQGFSIFVGAIQAYIFTILTMVYISHKIEVHH